MGVVLVKSQLIISKSHKRRGERKLALRHKTMTTPQDSTLSEFCKSVIWRFQGQNNKLDSVFIQFSSAPILQRNKRSMFFPHVTKFIYDIEQQWRRLKISNMWGSFDKRRHLPANLPPSLYGNVTIREAHYQQNQSSHPAYVIWPP